MARCETKREKPRLVFVSRHLSKTRHPAAFAPLDHMVEDDELVYAPSLCFTAVKGQHSLGFEGLVQQLYGQFFVDTWTTHSFVLHGESSKRLAPPRNTKDRKHLQSTQLTVDRHNSQTKHQALSKGQPGGRITPINIAAVHAFSTATTRHHHPHPTGSSPDPLSQHRQLRSLGAIHRQAESHYTTDTTRLSGDMQRPPPAGGSHHQEWLMATPGRTVCF